MLKPNQNYAVAIFGGGIVGMSLALSLSQLNIEVCLISNRQLRKRVQKLNLNQLETQQLKVSALSNHSLEFLSNLSLTKEIEQFAQYYQKMEVVDYEKQLTLNLNHSNFDKRFLVKNQFLGAVMPNCLIEQKLEQLIANSKIDYFDISSQKLDIESAIEISSSGVEIELDSSKIKADLLVGSDGSNSLIRKIAGLGYSQKNYEQVALVCYIQVEKPIENLAWQRFMADKTLAFLPCTQTFKGSQTKKNQQAGAYFDYSIVWTMDWQKFKVLNQKNDAEISAELNELSQNKFGRVRAISKWTHFPLIKKQAKNYAGRNVFLIGDAAHSIHPLAGMGLNLGLLDAHFLARHLQELKVNQKSFGEYQNLAGLAKKRYLDNAFAGELMDALANFYRLNIPNSMVNLVNPIIQKMMQKKPLKNKIIGYAQGFRDQ